ncbi:PAS domain-containing protein [Algoriphagus sp. A40]|uniref:PAS domain-containing sensor histidine kinase n=1 Tax=Algoriphagus sp. A40 TaxID=1945863 RepID=UPI0009875BBE|nr:PAS domain-containing protein [Algoriphagus sp. A40]OOG74823.1 hypothetical protein B0E43_10580 [Algoriphagus sp. A40]
MRGKDNYSANEMPFSETQTNKDILLEQFEFLTDSGTWELNLNTEKLTWSDGVFRMLGYKPREFEVNFESGLQIIHPEDREVAISQLQEAITGNSDYNIKKRLVRKDGEIIWVVSKAAQICDIDSGQKKLIGVFQNINEYIHTKEKLKSIKKKNKSLIENLDGIFWEADAQSFEFTYISSQVERITGFSPKEWMETKEFWQNHIHPFDREFATQTCHQETQKLQDHTFVYRFLTKDGKTIWLNDRVKVICKNGKPVKLQGMMVDVTREKEIEQALQNEIGFNRALIQQLPSVFFLVGTDGKFLLWNNQLEIASEFSFEEISIMEPEDFFAPEFHGVIQSRVPKILEEGAIDIELEVQTKSGRRIPYFFTVSKFPFKDKVCLFGTGQDISELVESRKSSAQHIERFQIVTQATSDAIWDFDRAKNTLYWGEGFLTLFGYDPKTTNPDFDFLLNLIHPDDRGKIYKLIKTYMDSRSKKSHWLEEYRFLKSDGNYAFVLDKAIFMRNEEGAVTRVVGAMQDISKQKDFEKSLKDLNSRLEMNIHELAISNLELQHFAFVVSHDLQEPLRMISSFMGLLERRYRDSLDQKALDYIAFATNGAKQMQKIILDLLELSRVGKVTGEKEKLDIGKLIGEVKQYMRKSLQAKQATLLAENLPVILTHKTPLLQIFQNLIGNALKYSKPDHQAVITILSREFQNHWEFSVEDNGIGIDPEYFNKIFVVFQRLHHQKEYDGTGIGLTIVKKAVEFLEGEIRVESEVGKGSKFTFTIKK